MGYRVKLKKYVESYNAIVETVKANKEVENIYINSSGMHKMIWKVHQFERSPTQHLLNFLPKVIL